MKKKPIVYKAIFVHEEVKKLLDAKRKKEGVTMTRLLANFAKQ